MPRSPNRLRGRDKSELLWREIYRVTVGYPSFLQEGGYQASNLEQASPIGLPVIRAATAAATPRLDRIFFRVCSDRLAPGQRRFLRAMAELGPGPHCTGALADVLGTKITSLGPARAGLRLRGLRYRRQETFAEDLEKNQAVEVYAKLPGWFQVPTPLGS